jgi:hypothetical protein
MGIIINDEIELETGLKLTGVYANIDDVKVHKSRATGKYLITADVFLWVNKEISGDIDKSPFRSEWINVGLDALPSNPHKAIYDEYKRRKKYTNIVDDI